MSFASVVPETRSLLPRDLYTYAVPSDLEERVIPGVRVEIPFGRRSILGYVVERVATSDHQDVRPIASVLEEQPLILEHHLVLARRVAAWYCAPLGEVVRAMLPSRVRARPTARRSGPRSMSRAVEEARAQRDATRPPQLTGAQQDAAAPLLLAIAQGVHCRVLLHGV